MLTDLKTALLVALEQAQMDMELMRSAMCAYDNEYFNSCITKVKTAINLAKGTQPL